MDVIMNLKLPFYFHVLLIKLLRATIRVVSQLNVLDGATPLRQYVMDLSMVIVE